MASHMIHLAVGKRYFEKNYSRIKDKQVFYNGVIAPDMVENKKESHYSIITTEEDMKIKFACRVSLYNYLGKNNVCDDYNRGFFLHLVTDYLFYNYFFEKEYVNTRKEEDYFIDIYYSYSLTNEYLFNKYQLDYNDEIKEKIEKNMYYKRDRIDEAIQSNNAWNILPKDKLIRFIEAVSNIDLDNYVTKILDAKTNVLPY